MLLNLSLPVLLNYTRVEVCGIFYPTLCALISTGARITATQNRAAFLT